MRLVAVFIKNYHFKNEDFCINFGGKYIYECNIINLDTTIEIKRKLNYQFINNFYGENLSLVSAVVGSNASGKTTIINDLLQINNGYLNIYNCESMIYIFEDANNVEILKRDAHDSWLIKIITNFTYKNFKKDNTSIIFYTPILDEREIYMSNSAKFSFNLSKFQFFAKDTEDEKGSFSALSEFHLSENLKRWIIFMGSYREQLIFHFKKLPHFNMIGIVVNKINFLKENFEYVSEDFNLFAKEFYEIWQKEYHRKNPTNKKRLELNIILRTIEKVFKILEETGNKYLREGKVKIRVTEIKKLNLKDAFYKFLEEHYYIKFKNVKLPVKEIKEFIETLINNLPENENDLKSHGWNKYNVDFNSAIKIINAYQNFISAFSKDFTYDKTILLTFKPNIDLSSGERGLLDLFSSFHSIKDEIISKNILVFIDEGDATFHPEWKIKYVNSIIKIFPQIFKEKKIQIIFTTHDPLTLSDIPDNNIVYLKNRRILNDEEKPKKTFGANISELLEESFFLENGLIGDFAKEKIEQTINWLNNCETKKSNYNNDFYIESSEKEHHLKVIELIDEKIIYYKLREKYFEIFPEKFEEEEKEKNLKKLAEELGYKIERLK